MPQFQQKLDPASNQVVRRIRVDGVPEGVVDSRVLSGWSSTKDDAVVRVNPASGAEKARVRGFDRPDRIVAGP
jgi:hypothetical protein